MNTLLNIKGRLIDVRFISQISDINFYGNYYGFRIFMGDSSPTLTIDRSINMDYDMGERIVDTKGDKPIEITRSDFIIKYRNNNNILEKENRKTIEKLEEKRQEIIQLRNELLNQDFSINVINIEGYE